MLHSLGVDTTAPELFPDLAAVKMTTAAIFREPRCEEAADKSFGTSSITTSSPEPEPSREICLKVEV